MASLSLLDDLEWWDANKPEKPSDQPDHIPAINVAEVSPNEHGLKDDHLDAMSVNSQAHLLPGTSSPTADRKPTKWLSKIMSPMSRKKRAEKDKSKHKPIAE